MPDEIPTPEAPTHSIVAEVSREIAFHGEVVVTVLGEIFTEAEAVLVNAGQFAQVRAQRQAFQDEIEPLFRQVVEEAAGRPAPSFLSQVTEEGIAVEVFGLAAEPELSI